MTSPSRSVKLDDGTKVAFVHPQDQSEQLPPQGVPDTSNTTLAAQINELRRLILSEIRTHKHDGVTGRPINLQTDILGMFETVSAVPTSSPTGAYGQIKIYVNGATLRLYWYDSVAHAWHYVTATA